MRITRSTGRCGIAILALLGWGVCLAAGCGPAGGADAEAGRYSVQRARDTLVRLDTSTGAAWSVPVSGDGGWLPIGGVPDPVGHESVPNRYTLRVVQSAKRSINVFDRPPTILFLADTRAGRTWMTELGSDSGWQPVLEPGSPEVPREDAENGGTSSG